MLKLSDLAMRPDFQVGPLLVSPSRRLLEGPGGYVHLEPLIMQVFLFLLDAGGKVVTRNELFEQCWGGVYVGDDSLNRAVAKVRRAGAQVAPGLYEIETIPRTGYRLTGEMVQVLNKPPASVEAAATSRRGLIGAGLAMTALAGTAGLWVVSRWSTDRRFDVLIEEARRSINDGSAFESEQTRRTLEEAVRMRPGSATPLGMLALLKSVTALGSAPKDLQGAITDAEGTARAALAIDRNEPNALIAMFELQGSTLDWFERDQRLRKVISIDPRNMTAIAELVLLTQAAGLNRESWNLNERALALEPLSKDFIGKRALKYWIAGRISSADKVIDQARAFWPANPWIWFIRFLILATTQRAKAAQAMVDSEPRMFEPAEAALWSACLPALDNPTSAVRAKATQACFEQATANAVTAGESVMILSAIQEVDAAFEVANGFLLERGSMVRKGKSRSGDATARVNTQWLFTPPCAVIRKDARFQPLCDGMGLVEYWRRRGVRPDYQLTER